MLGAFETALKALHEKGVAKHEDQWMPMVKNGWDSLIQAYQQLTHQDREPIDYSSGETQAAYLYA